MLTPPKITVELQRQVFAVGAHTLLHLGGQFARRRQDQRAYRAPSRCTAGRVLEPLQQRQGETGGLAGAGLRTGQDIAALENHGDGLRLHRGGFAVALFGDSTK